VRGQADKPPIIRSQLWTNRDGIVMKTAIAALRQETYRTSREIALADSGPRRLDLVIDNTVSVARPLDNPQNTRRVRYRVQLASDDPAKVFFAGPLQDVLSLDPHTAEITVRRHVPAENGDAFASAIGTRPPTVEDRAANNLIQSDDAQVLAQARTVAPDEKDAWTLAVALEKHVQTAVKLKNFSQAFATAAEVAREREGDCSCSQGVHIVFSGCGAIAPESITRHRPCRLQESYQFSACNKPSTGAKSSVRTLHRARLSGVVSLNELSFPQSEGEASFLERINGPARCCKSVSVTRWRDLVATRTTFWELWAGNM
jgi:hypothetical protein